MIVEPLNDGECLGRILAQVVAATERADVRELAARLGSPAEVVRYLRALPQRDDQGDPADGPRVACDVSQRVRLPSVEPNCVERAALYLALAELLDPEPWRTLATIDTFAGRHTYPLEDGAPVQLDPRITRNALAAGVHWIRNARGEGGLPLGPLGALAWAVELAAEPASRHRAHRERHQRVRLDLGRIARGLVPRDPALLTWALRLAVPSAVLFGPAGHAAIVAAGTLLDELGSSPTAALARGERR